MASTYKIDANDKIGQSTSQELELQSDDYDALQTNKQNEVNKTSDYEKSFQDVKNTPRKFISRRKVICAVSILVTVVVIATLIAVVITLTATSENDIDECSSGPCENGTCIDGMNNYRCVCDEGFNGTNCEHNKDECSSSPCRDGKCIDGINNYRCVCDIGFNGTNCEHNMDECSSSPCGNGTCIDGINKYTCLCDDGINGTSCEHGLSDCLEILRYDNSSADGVYTITTWTNHRLIDVYCDMSTDGGGWTVFQNRFDGSVDFYRNFSEYEAGFGHLNTEFWLGLGNIHELASQGQTSLRIDLESANGTKAYETFESFYLAPGPAYTLHLGPTIASSGIERESGSSHNGANFSTYDQDGVTSTSINSAVSFQGAWWYKGAYYTMNLNGLYLTPGTRTGKGMVYNGFVPSRSLKSSKMMMRRN